MVDAKAIFVDELYPSLSADTPCMLIFSVGSLGFRFGPMRAEDAGPHVTKALEMDVPMFVSFECGKEVDWDLVADLHGKGPAAPAEKAEGDL
jgi:hypothetical protein